MKAIILAGGRGARLKPYTAIFPKPLMPVGDKPILEIIIRQLKKYGFEEIIMAVGYLSEFITMFFNDGEKYGIKIKYSKENKPLGTAGPLALLKDELKETFLLMNGDILTTLDYSDLIKEHRKNKSIATIAVQKKGVKIDFGTIDLDNNGKVINYTEKLTLDYLVSMGICVFEPDVLRYITPNEYLDFPDLIKKLISDNKSVKGYIYDGYWLDIGRPDDYEQANRDTQDKNKIF